MKLKILFLILITFNVLYSKDIISKEIKEIIFNTIIKIKEKYPDSNFKVSEVEKLKGTEFLSIKITDKTYKYSPIYFITNGSYIFSGMNIRDKDFNNYYPKFFNKKIKKSDLIFITQNNKNSNEVNFINPFDKLSWEFYNQNKNYYFLSNNYTRKNIILMLYAKKYLNIYSNPNQIYNFYTDIIFINQINKEDVPENNIIKELNKIFNTDIKISILEIKQYNEEINKIIKEYNILNLPITRKIDNE